MRPKLLRAVLRKEGDGCKNVITTAVLRLRVAKTLKLTQTVEIHSSFVHNPIVTQASHNRNTIGTQSASSND